MIAEFTTLVGLIATFKQLGDGRKADDKAEFLKWLVSHKFEALSEQIGNSDHMAVELNELLRLDTAEIMTKLETIEGAVLSVSQKIDGLKGLARTFPESEALSDQAVAILGELDQSESGMAMLFARGSERFLLFLPHGKGRIHPTEPKYFLDDIDSLESLGWISFIGHNSEGKPKYQITRAGSQAAKQIQSK